MQFSLSELVEMLGAELQGSGDTLITGLAALPDAVEGDISFLSNSGYQAMLESSKATAVVVREQDAALVKCAAVVVKDPYLAYAKLSQWFDNRPAPEVGIHSSATIHPSACLGQNVSVGANVVIGRNVVLGDNTEIGPGCFVGDNTRIGQDGLLNPNVTVFHDVIIGDRVRILSSTVIGGDGFGYAPDRGGWERIAQLGGVVIGNDVSIGANTCIDRGALGDTIIGDNVILDNLIQIAHNVKVGSGTAMAGCVGIAGSTEVGKNCMLAGGVGLAGHIKIADGVQIMGMTLVTNSIDEPGVYASGMPHLPVKQWRRNATRFKQLDALAKRLQKLEKTQEGKA
ncbi:MAG: UDP-3-O-(3-hydroxymyristoyl)glucosamine N-acyltransferase [Oceanospirillaceae bacterium]|nr:UDP-3-O-(3-hydroxymyristoyl)glucosamine N-acyltransferase [Oceanospirillaceae bacterium]|tara:strand:+ start:424 stop:1446 length:1023 start_codon:yes stop_codon:yes gene_type:complete